MRVTTIFLTLLFATLTLSTTTVLAEEKIYRWVDENGVVHFGNRPEGHGNAETVELPPPPAVEPQAAPEPTSPYDANPEPSYAQILREERAKSREEAAEKRKETEVMCQKHRERVAKLEPFTRVIYEQEDGTAIRMDDNDRLELLAESKAFIAENCNK